MKILSTLIITVLLYGCASNGKYSQFIFTSIPQSIDTNKNYLFFMHGKIVEKKGLPANSRKYGDYEYESMLNTFASNGYIVISEARDSGTDILDYSYGIKDQIEGLIKAGVSPSKITVSGFSKGGRMTLVVSNLVENKDIHYVVLAGCRNSDIDTYDLIPSGKVLSIYDINDDTFGSCSDIFSGKSDTAITHEIILNVGYGHGVFYQPMPEWVNPMVEWSKK